MRGTPIIVISWWARTGIIPAHAGNTGRISPRTWMNGDHPRACGEHLPSSRLTLTCMGSSPRMRGTPQLVRGHGAHAVDHPRACGEHSNKPIIAAEPAGSSPRMRGTRRLVQAGAVEMGIIPAHAGNTVAHDIARVSAVDHPRACGEHPCFAIPPKTAEGSSPRMRGTPRTRRSRRRTDGIIPAHAGNTASRLTAAGSAKDHPRACGEHEWASPAERDAWGSSPRMRGTPPMHRSSVYTDGIIPAHAGNTVSPCQ